MILEILSGACLLVGAGFMLVAAVGVLRMPDLLMRMHAATKAGTLGIGLVLTAVAVHHREMTVAIRAGVTIFFLVATAPVAAHLIARAGYRSGTRLWERTRIDEWGG